MATTAHQFNNITLGGRVSSTKGVLKVNSTMFLWRTEAGRVISVLPTDLSQAFWTRIYGRVFQLKLQLNIGNSIKFDGFRESDYDVLKTFLSENFHVELTTVQLATKGLNWGEYELAGPVITLAVDGKHAFEIPVSEISGAVMQPTQKNEVAIEFHQDSTLEDEDESLVDIRFFIPNRSTEEGSKTSAQILHKGLLDVIGGGIQGKDRIATLNKVPILTPRGRYDIELYPTFMKFRGKTHDYKVTYESVSRLFQLPKPDQHHIFFIVTLDPPIRQGTMRYPHLVMHFKMDEKSPPVPITLPADLKEKEQFKSLPEEFKDADAYEVVNKLFRAFTQRKITTPGSFKSHSGASAVKCAFKANDGFLFLLERSFFFVHKPPLHMRFEEVSSVEFARVASSTNAQANRTFDLVIRLSDSTVHQFTGIQRNEYGSLFNFIQSKKLRIENPDEATEELAGLAGVIGADDDEESEEDEDFVDEGEEEDEEYDSNESESGEEAEEKPKKDKHEGKRKKSDGEEKPKKKKKAAEEEED
eukprot:Phypoly_transcript_05191.p1 GENE.Phypoly_transcript_05191~~Phypoly_transcript_05191.p1  ORF type:complete len:529 (+),score=85.58 Phypoly_transcript_05191:330-1916(+)